MPVLTKINSNVIADDAITGDKFSGDAYLANSTTQNITGTYSENRLYTSDAYTLSGNTTVNSELILSSVKPTGDVVLTASGAYTITGTGVLSGGTMYPRNSLTGMTGTIGSTVTNNAGVASGIIASSPTFPSGHVVKTTFKGCSAGITVNNVREAHCNPNEGIEALEVTAGNKLAIWFMGGNLYTSTNDPYYSTLKIVVQDAGGDTHYETAVFGAVGSDARFDAVSAFTFHTIAANTKSVNILYGVRGNYISAAYYFWLVPAHYDSGDASGMRFVVQEIQA